MAPNLEYFNSVRYTPISMTGNLPLNIPPCFLTVALKMWYLDQQHWHHLKTS